MSYGNIGPGWGVILLMLIGAGAIVALIAKGFIWLFEHVHIY